MAKDIIDELQLKISADTGKTTAKVDKVAESLNKLATSVGKLSANMQGFSGLSSHANSLQSLSQIKTTDLNKAVKYLEKLSNINFKNLDGKRLSVNINTGNVKLVTKQLSDLKKTASSTSSLQTRLHSLGRLGADFGRSLNSGFNIATKAIKSGVRNMNHALDTLRNKLSLTKTVAYSVKAAFMSLLGFRGLSSIFGMLRDSIVAGGDITEIDHIVESVFEKNMVNYVHTWANAAIESFGIAEAQAKQYAGTLSSMFQASGVTTGNAGKMAMDLVGLAGDLSAFYNTSTAEAYEKIKSGMSGMVRPLRSMGIDLTAATLEEFRLAQGIETAYSAMSQAEKVMLRYKYLMSVTTTQQGDFERTQYSLANATRTLKANFSALSTQIGVGIASAIRPAIVALNRLMKTLITAAKAYATFMQTIFGKYKGGASGIAVEGLEDSADYAEDLADGAGGAAGALEDADDAAKKLKKDLSVLPFDELNQLNKDREEASSSDGGGGGGGAGGGGGDWAELDLGLDDLMSGGALADAISEWGDRIKNAFKAKEWESLGKQIAWGINRGIDKVYDVLNPQIVKQKVTPFIDAFTNTFNSLVDAVHWDKMGRVVGRGINDIVYIADRFITGIDWTNLGRKFAAGANGLVDEVDFRAAGKLIGDKIMIVWKTLYGWAENFDWKNLGKKLGDGINGLNDAINWKTIAHAITTSFNGVFDALREFTTRVEWDAIADNIVDGLSEFIKNTNWQRNGKSLGMFIDNLCDALIDIIDRTDWEGFGMGLARALQQIPWKKMLKVVGKVVVDAFGGILKGLATTPAGAFASAVISGIIAFRIGSKLMPFVSGIVEAITGQKATVLLSNGVQSMMRNGMSSIAASAGGSAGFGTLAGVGIAGAILFGLEMAFAKAEQRKEKIRQDFVDDLVGNIDMEQMLNTDAIVARTSALEADIAAWKEELSTMEQYQVENQGVLETHYKDEEAARRLAMAISQGSDEINNLRERYVELAMEETDSIKAKDDLREALNRLNEQGKVGDGFDILMANLNGTESAAYDASTAYDMTASTLRSTGGDVDAFIAILEELGYSMDNHASIAENTANRVSKAEMRAAQESIDAANNQADALEWWQNSISEFRDMAVQKLTEIGNQWGTLDADQEETLASLTENLNESVAAQQVAIENMEKLNSAGLDAATVQASLDQIDPSSQAMTDLIGHMEAKDAEWEQFHSSLETQLDMKDQINKMADEMAEEYGRKLAPTVNKMVGDNEKEFLVLGKSFEVEGGKASNFYIDGVVTGFQKDTDQAVGRIKTFGYNVADGLKDGMEEKQGAVENVSKNLADKGIVNPLQNTLQTHSPSKVTEEIGRNVDEGLVSGINNKTSDVIRAVNDMSSKMKDAFKDLPNNFREYASKIVESTKTELNKMDSVFTNVFSGITRIINSEKASMRMQGQSVGQSFSDGISSGFNSAQSAINSLVSSLKYGLDINLWNEGYNAGQSFANGFSSVHVPTPHMYVSNWNYHDLGDGGYMYTPDFSVNWYKGGGLFKGGQGTLIGIAEGNRDEAVLPIENRVAMSKIGQAIADAGGAYGSDSMADRIASKVAEAIIMTQTDNNDPIFHIEVKTEDNETLARAVTKGQRQIDYRNNPTPAYGY